MIKCPKCENELERMYSKEYLDEHFPVKSPNDSANIKIQIESKRLFECKKCGHKYRLSDVQYGAYILSQTKKFEFKKFRRKGII